MAGQDPDLELAPLARLHRWATRLPHHGMQHVFLLPLTLLVAFKWVFIEIYGLVVMEYKGHVNISSLANKDRVMGICLRLFFISRFVILPLVLRPTLVTAVSIALTFMTAGGYLGLFFIISHNFEGVTMYNAKVDGPDGIGATLTTKGQPTAYETSWVVRQIESSSTVGGRWLGWLNGGLNYQIEHHLFPRVCHQHYHIVAHVVRSWCKAKGVKYNHFPTVQGNLTSTFSHLFSLGNSDD